MFPIDAEVTRRSMERAEAEREARQTPAAHDRRARSRVAFRGLGADEALALARSEHAGLARRPLGRALGLRQGQRVVRFLSARSALVDVGGDTVVAASMSPMAVRDGDGQWAAVDLDLVQAGSGFEVQQPAVGVRVASRAGQTTSVGDSGLGVIPLAGAQGVNPILVDGRVFWPNALPDTDVLAMPVPEGVEVAYFLRSPSAAEELKLGLALPHGAAAQRGIDPLDGVRIAKDGKDIGHVSAPTAVDASGQSLDVKYSIRDGDLFMQIDHRNRDVEYPIAVDPIVDGTASVELEQEWQNLGHSFAGWTQNVVHQDGRSLPWRFAAGSVGAGNGLNIWHDAGYYYPWERADWYHEAPGDSSIVQINVRSIQWWLSASCIWIGVNRVAGGSYPWLTNYEDCRGERHTVNNGYFYGVGPLDPYPDNNYQRDKHMVVLVNHTGTHAEGDRGFHMTHWGNVEMFYTDRVAPDASAPTAPTNWINPDRTSGAIRGTATDTGVGLAKTGIDASWLSGTYDFGGSNNCTGNYDSICPATDTETVDMRNVHDGRHTVKTRGEDLVGQPAESGLTTLRVDRVSPTTRLSGASVDDADTHKAVGAGRHAIDVTGSDPPAPGAAFVSGARTTTLSVTGLVPELETKFATSGCSENCTVTGRYTLDGGAPPAAFGRDTFTDAPGRTLQTHTPEAGGPWTRHASSTGDVIVNAFGRARRASTGTATALLTGVHSSADYDVTADVFVGSLRQKAGDASIVARFNSSTGEGYFATYSATAGQWVIQRRRADGTFVQLGSTNASVNQDGIYRILLKVRGSWLGMFVNGERVLDATDSTLAAAGRVGVSWLSESTGSAQANDFDTPQLDNFASSGLGKVEGVHRLNLQTTDGAGNAFTRNVDVVVDRTAPIQEPAFGPVSDQRAINSGTHEVYVTASDPGVWPTIAGMGRFELLVDNTLESTWTPPAPGQRHTATLTVDGSAEGGLNEGRHTALVRAYDDAIRQPQGTGNPTTNPQSFQFIVDRTPPEMTPDGPLRDNDGKAVDHGTYALQITAVDRTSDGIVRAGVGTIEVFVDGESDFSESQPCQSGDCTMQRTYTFDTREHRGGWHDIEVVSTDLAGNEDVERYRIHTPCCVDATSTWDTLIGRDVRFGDVTGDALDDLVTRDRLTGDLDVRPSVGGDFGPPQRWGSLGLLAEAGFELGDVNGDEVDDVVARFSSGDPNRDSVQVLRSTGASFAGAETWGTWPSASDLHVREVGGDDFDDLVGRDPNTGAVIAAYSGTSAFDPEDVWAATNPNDRALYGDLDGDAAADLVLVSGTNRLLVGLSQGNTFAPATDWGGIPANSDVTLSDADGDGVMDVIVRSRVDGATTFMASTESSFAAPVNLGTWDPQTTLESPDVSGDDHGDLAGIRDEGLTQSIQVAVTTAPFPSDPQIEVPEFDPLEDGDEVLAAGTASRDDAVIAQQTTTPYAPPPLGAQMDPELVWRELHDIDYAGDAFAGRQHEARAEAQINQILDRLRQSGVSVIRVNLWWGMVQNANRPAGAPPTFNFDRFSESITHIINAGFDVHLTLSGIADPDSGLENGRCHMNAVPDANGERFASLGCSGPHRATGAIPASGTARTQAMSDWAAFVQAAVAHFSTLPERELADGTRAARPVTQFALWNEPNYTGKVIFLNEEGRRLDRPANVISTYRELYTRGYGAITGLPANLRRNVKVLFGELAAAQSTYWRLVSNRWRQDRITAVDWIRAVAPAGSARLITDGVAYHPYQHGHAPWRRGTRVTYGIGRLVQVRRVLRELSNALPARMTTPGGRTPRLYLSEFGYFNTVPKRPEWRYPEEPATPWTEREAFKQQQKRRRWHTEAERARWFYGGRTRSDGLREYGALEQARRVGARLLALYAVVERPPRNSDDPEDPDAPADDYGIMGSGRNVPESDGRKGRFQDWGSPLAEIINNRRYGKDRDDTRSYRRAQPRTAYCTIRQWAARQPGDRYTLLPNECAQIAGLLPRRNPLRDPDR